MRRRQALSLGVIAALIVAIWAAWAAGDDPPPPTTIIVTDPTTTTTAAPTTTMLTTAVPPPTTTPSTSSTSTTTDIEARTEEVRQILEDLYFRWFDAIYHNDEEAVLEVIATEQRLESFHDLAASHDYERPPERGSVQFRDLEILHAAPECLVIFGTLDLTEWLGEGMTSSGVDVLWPYGDGWRRATLWTHRDDLWESDCEATREELP